MNKNLSYIAVVMISIILVVIIYQTFILKQYTTYNYMGIVAFIIFLAISVYDLRNAEDEEE
jgi:competence protein ComGF